VLGWQIIRRVLSGAAGLGPTGVATDQLQHHRRRTVILGDSITTVAVMAVGTAGRGAGVAVEWQFEDVDGGGIKVPSVFRWMASAGAVRRKPRVLKMG
jgi:hypothetical protein